MQRDTFSYLITNPNEFTTDDLVYLEQLVGTYPFCQTGHVLLAKGYNNRSDTSETLLRKAAVYSLSRSTLRKFMEGEFPKSTPQPNQSLPFARRHARETDVTLKPTVEEINPVQALRGLDYSEVLLQKNEESKEKEEQKADQQDQLSIIDRFIQAEPRIGPLRSKPGQPEEVQVDLALKPQQSNNTPITEGYAKVLARQGKTEKAIQVYEKLQLKFPEKKTYFAEKIQDLKTQSPLS